MEQTEKLKKEKAVLLQEMEEKKEIDEFNSLEEESKREYEVIDCCVDCLEMSKVL